MHTSLFDQAVNLFPMTPSPPQSAEFSQRVVAAAHTRRLLRLAEQALEVHMRGTDDVAKLMTWAVNGSWNQQFIAHSAMANHAAIKRMMEDYIRCLKANLEHQLQAH